MKIKAVEFFVCELQKYWGQMYDFSAADVAWPPRSGNSPEQQE